MTKEVFTSSRSHLQNGTTMLSLMVGILVSTLSILASLSIYQNLKVAAFDTSNGLVHDSQITATLLIAEKIVMNAGYGILDADEEDMKVVTQAATSTTPELISLLWRYVDGATVVCKGFQESGLTIDGRPYRTLMAIESVGDCTLSADLETLSWTDEIAILGQWLVTDELADHLSDNDTLFDFQVSAITCTPYGYGVPGDHLGVRISAPGTIELNGVVTVGGNESLLCLSNLSPA